MASEPSSESTSISMKFEDTIMAEESNRKSLGFQGDHILYTINLASDELAAVPSPLLKNFGVID